MKAVGLIGSAEDTVVLGGSYDFGLYAWRVRWGERSEGPRAGSLLTDFGQAVSTICQIGAHAAVVAAWDGQIAIVNIDDNGDPQVVARTTLAELIGRTALLAMAQ